MKSALVALCYYEKVNKSLKKEDKENNIMYCHHRSKMRLLLSENDIDDHISQSASEIDKDIEEMLRWGSNWRLVWIEKLYIEAYTYRQATSGSYISTPKKLANTKCTINPDNKNLIDPETNTLSEKCLQGVLKVYFAY